MTEDTTHNHRADDAAEGATLRGDGASGAGVEWRGKLDELRESRKERRRWRGLKQPLIGLTMAGAAAPMAHAIHQNQPDSLMPERATARGQQAMAGDIEDAVGERWAEARNERIRGEAIQSAVAKYDIDEELASAIFDISKEEGIEHDVAYGLVKTESTFRQRAVSSVGARGLTQVLPSTARWMMPDEIRRADQLFERDTNLRVGFRYLRYLLDKYEGDTRLALLAYNRGPGTVDRVLNRGGDPDNGYATKVLRG